MAEKATWAIDPIERIGRWTLGSWRLTGGGLSNPLAKIKADGIGSPMHRQSNPRLHNVVGKGLLTFSRLGRVKLEAIPNRIQFDRVFEPDMKNRAVNDHRYAQLTAAR